MIYVVEMDVNIPESWSEDKLADYIKREQETSQKMSKIRQMGVFMACSRKIFQHFCHRCRITRRITPNHQFIAPISVYEHQSNQRLQTSKCY